MGMKEMEGVNVWDAADVRLVAVPQVDWSELEAAIKVAGFEDGRLSAHWENDQCPVSDAEALAEFGGRGCYMSFGRGRDSVDYFENILSSKHGSVLEHAQFSVYLQGISRTLTHEFVRHRAGWGYSQLSQRYVDSSDTGFVLPYAMRNTSERAALLRGIWLQSCRDDIKHYNALADVMADEAKAKFPDSPTDARKWQRQTARSVLGGCAETKILASGNARAWRHFFGMRGAMAAEGEIRAVAIQIWEKLLEAAPLLFGDIDVVQDDSGERCLTLKFNKV